ncbi:Dihydrofolate synthase/folylpolyglutamate synthase (DHFS / FPGS) (Folylpoly-gamma-glutamate synthetase-dihydrofolate synthetase) (Folylpolyglutamate synthetase) (Tetrahydrofolylpolyglutamate synthase) [Durusdinium trenchii]|uniref:Dihydrofolate synthase/folylpolyglutamate synthase (DHFS / FPGS) (Folylpoly-gamma-glutamate synthetase-dihydrofolate synthetase) (Folylpolyglutamate synthetase) (Tetrahydrofolylpolyglutamate synthase) n=1 Tax=Durusdinium trenchii TaxID=1381693 RepID=A0ABP0K2Y8_9DINO
MSMDLFPTVLEAAGVTCPHPIDGVSIVPTLSGKGQVPLREFWVFRRREGGLRYGGKTIEAIRQGDWKLLQNSPFQPLELYNLAEDPLEETDLAQREKGTLQRLNAELRRQIQRSDVSSERFTQMDERTPATTSSAHPPVMTPDPAMPALAFLYGRLNFESAPDRAQSVEDFKLARMADLLSRLGDPQLSLPAVHIAGSKGKGSTATMMARILERAGRTLPVCVLWPKRWMRTHHLGGPTFFELATAIGWLHFQQEQAEIVVLEVGLGGRLDATNLCRPAVTAITSISYDHMHLLGNSLAEIAAEKAGIIKRGVPVFSGVEGDEAAPVIALRAAEQAAPLTQIGATDPFVPRRRENAGPFALYEVDVPSPDGVLTVRPAMPGSHQARNAAIAAGMAVELARQGFAIRPEAIASGIADVRCSLRCDVISSTPLVVVDSAHNNASISALCETLLTAGERRRTFLFGTSRDKDVSTMLRTLDRFAHRVILTRFEGNPRGVAIDELARMAGETLSVEFTTATNPSEALRLALSNSGPEDLICATGSFFLAAETHAVWTELGTSLLPR